MKSISKFFFLIISAILVSYLIYVRLIMIRLPRDLICTEGTFPYYLFSFSIFFCIFIIKIFTEGPKDKISTNSTKSLVQRIKDNLHFEDTYAYYSKQLTKCHQYIVDHLDFMDDILNFLLKIILKHDLNLRTMYFGLTYGPRYLVSIVFFFECILFQRLSLFYSCLPLLFVPLLWQYMLFALKKFVENHIEYLNNFIEIEVILSETENYKVNAQIYNDFMLTVPLGTEVKAFINFNASAQEFLTKQGRNVLEETKVIVALFYSLVNFNHLSIYVDKLKFNYNLYFQLGSIVIYMISWLYIIFFTGDGYGLSEVITLFSLILNILGSKEEPFSGISIG